MIASPAAACSPAASQPQPLAPPSSSCRSQPQPRACRKARMMPCGCTPSSTNARHSLRNSAASSTTVVVPSPTWEGVARGRAGGREREEGSMTRPPRPAIACCRPLLLVGRAVQHPPAPSPAPTQQPSRRRTSASCASEMSTSVLAAGCTMSSVFMIVAPSLDTVTDRSVCMSLSMPRGPARCRAVQGGAGEAGGTSVNERVERAGRCTGRHELVHAAGGGLF